MQTDPAYLAACQDRGAALLELGAAEEAVQVYDYLMRRQPECAEAHYNLGLAQQAASRIGAAAASFRRALQLRPEFVAAAQSLGFALHTLGRLSEAAASYRQALRFDPDSHAT